MSNKVWRVLSIAASTSATCWGVTGAVHLGFVYSGGPRGGSYGLPDGGGWYTLAFMLGLPVAFYSYAGGGFVEPVFRKKWWYALTVTFGTTVGAVSILALG